MRVAVLSLISGLLLAGCNQAPPPAADTKPEPWSNEAEELFQTAESLKYSLEQHKLEQARLQELGIEGQPPEPRR